MDLSRSSRALRAGSCSPKWPTLWRDSTCQIWQYSLRWSLVWKFLTIRFVQPKQCWQRSLWTVKKLEDKGLVWELFFAKSRLWVKWFSKGRKLDEFYVPFFSIIFLIHHLNPYCYSPFLITSAEREQFGIGWIIPKKAWPMQNLVRGLVPMSCPLCFYLRTVHKGTLIKAHCWFAFSLLSTLIPLFFCYCCFTLKGSVCVLRIVFPSQVNCSF